MRIDVHAHYFPVEYLDRLDRYGGSQTTLFFRKANLAFEGFSGLDAHFHNMDLAKVDLQVLSVSGQLPYFANRYDGPRARRTRHGRRHSWHHGPRKKYSRSGL